MSRGGWEADVFGEKRKAFVGLFGGLDVLSNLLEVRFGRGEGIGGVLAEGLQGEARESFKLAVVAESGFKGGGHWREQTSMRESNQVPEFGRVQGSIGGMAELCLGHVNLPKAIGGGVAVASEDGGVVLFHGQGMLGESGCAIVVTELADGKQRRVKVMEDESFGRFWRKAGNGKGANGIRMNGGTVGHGDGDGVGICSNRSGTVRSRGKEMAGSAGVSYNWFCCRGII